MKEQNNRNESMIEGRNAVLEAFRSGKTVDKLYNSGRMSGRACAYDRPGGKKA